MDSRRRRLPMQSSGTLLGVPAGEIRLDDRSVAVRVRAPDSVRFDPRLLGVASDLFAADAGARCRSARSRRFEPVDTRAELLRENQQQMIAMTADLAVDR